MLPLVSVITPTFNRSEFLKKCLRYFLAQDYPHLEWLILDDSPQASTDFTGLQANIRYQHLPYHLTIGEKRNLLVEQAKGEIIIHFDDDDYYSPSYISTMVIQLHRLEASLINLRGWYLFDMRSRFFGYWDLLHKEGWHYRCANPTPTITFFDEAYQQAFATNHLGYGFGYAYRKEVWNKVPFDHINFCEDTNFVLAASQHFKIDGVMDETGICLHFLHPQSTSTCYPQFNLPLVSFPQIFGSFEILT